LKCAIASLTPEEYTYAMKSHNAGLIIAGVFLIGTLGSAAAQSQAPSRFEFGVKGGLALPSFFWTGDNGWNQVTVFAMQAEAYGFACMNFNGKFGIQAEAGYSGKGCKLSASDGYARWYMDYLEVPVWAKWSSRSGPDLNVYGGLGGYAAWFIGGRYDFSTGEPGLDGKGKLERGTADSPTTVRPTDFGVLLVCGMEGRHMIVEFRMPIGVVKSMQFTPPPVFGGARGSLNSGLGVIVGYRL
jgi:hypothetical protein